MLIAFLAINTNQLMAQTRRQIIIEQADEWRPLKKDGIEIRRLIGNVIMRHDDVRMKCDSAYEYTGTSRFDAFGKVVIYQQNSTLYGDTLYYDGSTKKGRIRGKIVKLVDDDAVLTTKFLNFNTLDNTITYFNGGVITNPEAHISSSNGIYFSKQKRFIFSGNVAFKGEDFLINTDSMEYNSNLELINFHGPTRIYSEDSYLYCEKGWHNRKEEKSEFLTNVFIDNGKQRIFGQKVYYDKKKGFSQIIDNGCIIDTSRNFTIYGDDIKYFEETEYAEVRKNPLAVSISEKTDTLYLRADLLTSIGIKDEVKTDSTIYRIMRGIGNVKFFRNDIQGVCDSMVFNSSDSILHMYVDPILWNEENQLTADNVSIAFKNEMIHRINFIGSSFICSQEDSIRFNQIKGREMIGFFSNNKLTRLDVNGNGETVYFARDKGVINYVNRAESSRLSINVRDNQVVSIMFREKPTTILYPIDKVDPQEVTLKGFTWHIDKRPKTKEEVFPNNFNPNFFIPIQDLANKYRLQRKDPAKSL
jgi:lipopolysaccharide export system protein LptA